jgi:hypothetical protein
MLLRKGRDISTITSEFDESNIITGKRRSRPVSRYEEDIATAKIIIKTGNSRSASSKRIASNTRSTRLTKKKETPAAKKRRIEREAPSSSEKGSDSENEQEESEAEIESESDEDIESDVPEDTSSSEEEEVVVKPRSKYLASVNRRPTKKPLLSTPKAKPLTSSNRVIHRVNQALPVIPLRRVNTRDELAMTPYALARERLHVSAVPESLPCREDEFLNILGYVESAIQEATGTCVYISGVPGTGKTATVLEVIRHLQQQAEEQTIPAFDFVEINGMKLTDPNQAYSILWECMDRTNQDTKKKKYTAAHALQMLEAKFSKQSVDERTT